MDFKEIWQMPTPEMSDREIDEAFQDFTARIDRKSRQKKRCLWKQVGIAASVALCLGFGSGLAYMDTFRPDEVAWSELSVPFGKMDTLMLTDGTRIFANAGTTVLFPTVFTGGKREIFFIGELFLEVAKDGRRPFILHTQSSEIRVTGTRFNVRSYPQEASITTLLVEGGVQVLLPNQDQAIRMTPGKVLQFDKSTGEIELRNVPSHTYPSWYKGEFDAFHKTFRQIADDLERRFDVRIDIDDKSLADRMFYASFVNGEDVSRILEAMNMNNEFRIRHRGDSYIISTN